MPRCSPRRVAARYDSSLVEPSPRIYARCQGSAFCAAETESDRPMIDDLAILFSCAMLIYVVLRGALLERREKNEQKQRVRPGAFSE